jgi:hypothetical protein
LVKAKTVTAKVKRKRKEKSPTLFSLATSTRKEEQGDGEEEDDFQAPPPMAHGPSSRGERTNSRCVFPFGVLGVSSFAMNVGWGLL